MLEVQNLNYASTQTVYFQRLSVIFTELLLVFALQKSVPPGMSCWRGGQVSN